MKPDQHGECDRRDIGALSRDFPLREESHREIARKALQHGGSGAHELFRLNTEPPARGLLKDNVDLRDEEDNSPRALEEVFAT